MAVSESASVERAVAARARLLRTRLRGFAMVSGILGVAAAVVALVGWITQTLSLTRPLGGSASMTANAALCIAALGVAVGSGAWRPETCRTLWWRVLCAAVVAVTGLTLLEYVLSANLGIDELLFSDHLTRQSPPGRMAAVTAACLLLLGAGLLVGTARIWRARLRTIGALAAAWLAGVSALGYVFGASELYRPVGAASIAVQTALALLVLSAATLALEPSESALELWVSRGPGGILVRWVIPGLSAGIILVAWLRLEGEKGGWYGTAFGLAVMTITNITILWLVIGATARRLEGASRARRSAEHEAATATGDLEAILDASPAAIYVKDVDGRYLLANRRYCELFVPDGRAVVGLGDEDVFPPDVARERMADDATIVSGGEAVESTESFEHDDGTHTYLTLRFPLTEGHGVRAVCGIFTDITERTRSDQRERALQSRLARSERLESMGRLASGIAHDFNNLLSVILVTAELLGETSPPDSQQREDVAMIADTAHRAAALTQQLLIYARRSVGNPTAVDCNVLVTEMGTLLTRTIGEDLRLAVVPHATPAIVVADQVQLESVIMNLAVNARDAMPSGGDLTISCDVVDADEDMLAGEGSGPGRYARITVADTGVGMDRGVLVRAFEPFFTTKSEGTGTGLGLATVFGVVTGAGGLVRVYSEIGIGTTVRCYFPLSEQAATTPARVTGPETNRHADITVLVVEDADDLRAAVVRLLSRAGFRTHAVDGIDEAFEYVRRGAEPVDLVLTDVIMPGGSGPELARRLAELRPQLPVAFMTGYAGNALEMQGFDPTQHTVIEKPFTRESLVGAVTAMLDAREVASTP